MMKLYQLMLVAVLVVTVFTGETIAQERMFGNGRFLRKLRDDLTGRRKETPQLKKPTSAKAPPKSPAKALAGKTPNSNVPTPATRAPKAPTPAPPNRNAWPTNRNNVPTPARTVERKPNLKAPDSYLTPGTAANATASAPKEAKRSDKKQTLGFGMLLETKSDKLVVTRIDPKGNANKSGLKAGDQVFKAAGVKLNSMDEFNQITEVLRDGDQIEVEFSRRGKTNKELVMFGKGPDLDDVETIEPAEVAQTNGSSRSSKPNYDFVPQSRNSGAPSVVAKPTNAYRAPDQQRSATRSSAERIEFERALEQQRREIERLNAEMRRLRSQGPVVTQPATGNSVLQVPDLTGPGLK